MPSESPLLRVAEQGRFDRLRRRRAGRAGRLYDTDQHESGADQDQVLHHELAVRRQRQRVAVLEHQRRRGDEGQEGAGQVPDQDEQRHPPEDAAGHREAEDDLDARRAPGTTTSAGKKGRVAASRSRTGLTPDDLQRAEPDEHDRQGHAQRERGEPLVDLHRAVHEGGAGTPRGTSFRLTSGAAGPSAATSAGRVIRAVDRDVSAMVISSPARGRTGARPSTGRGPGTVRGYGPVGMSSSDLTDGAAARSRSEASSHGSSMRAAVRRRPRVARLERDHELLLGAEDDVACPGTPRPPGTGG